MLHQFKEESSHHTQLNGFFVNNVILTRYRTRNAIKIMQPIGVRKKETVQQQTKIANHLKKIFVFILKANIKIVMTYYTKTRCIGFINLTE